MTLALDISWLRGRVRAGRVALAVALVVGGSVAVMPPRARGAEPMRSVVVRATERIADAEWAVARVGGRVVRELPIIGGLEADVPAGRDGELRRAPGVASVTANSRVHLLSIGSYDPVTDLGPQSLSMYNVASVTNARAYWWYGYTGKGVDVALIDSGVAPVTGLDAPGKVVHGPDLSFESQNPDLAHRDTNTHGTHLAGIIAGQDVAEGGTAYYADTSHFLGMAPDARLVSLKVADANGATDVSQMIAAIDWVVQHKDDYGLHIRVLNLSFGTTGFVQSSTIDPLADAAEQAWKAGIVVVAAAGNDRTDAKGWGCGLTNPAYDKYVLAVGAADANGTVSRNDDSVAGFSNGATSTCNRYPDLVAPGVHVASLRDPGSEVADEADSLRWPNAVADPTNAPPRFFRGSGTSQAAAVVSGAAALVLSRFPDANPDQVKRYLRLTADPLGQASTQLQGQGELSFNFKTALPSASDAKQSFATSDGTGTLDASRGQAAEHLTDDLGNVLSGEQDVFGNAVYTSSLAQAEAARSSWNGGYWNVPSVCFTYVGLCPSSYVSAHLWTGTGFVTDPVTGQPMWATAPWSATSWARRAWTDPDWAGHSWSGHRWSGHSWSDSDWSGHTWSADVWSGHRWSGHSWSDVTWQ